MIVAASSGAVPPPVLDVITAPEVTTAVVALLVAILGYITVALRSQQKRFDRGLGGVRVHSVRAADKAEEAAHAAQEAAHEVKNTHTTNLRDDLDEKVATILTRMDAAESARRESAEQVHEQIAEIKEAQRSLDRRLGHELGEIRKDKLSAHEDIQRRLGRLEEQTHPQP